MQQKNQTILTLTVASGVKEINTLICETLRCLKRYLISCQYIGMAQTKQWIEKHFSVPPLTIAGMLNVQSPR